MKKLLVALSCGLAMLLAGCAGSNSCSCKSCPSPSDHQRVTYDPVKNVTIIENEGYSWCLAGHVTNVMIYPVKSR